MAEFDELGVDDLDTCMIESDMINRSPSLVSSQPRGREKWKMRVCRQSDEGTDEGSTLSNDKVITDTKATEDNEECIPATANNESVLEALVNNNDAYNETAVSAGEASGHAGAARNNAASLEIAVPQQVEARHLATETPVPNGEVAEVLAGASDEGSAGGSVRKRPSDASQGDPIMQREVHLITWSQADVSLLPELSATLNSRETFGELVEKLFEGKSAKKERLVSYWACAKEPHESGGEHFHLAMKFSKKVRWLKVANALRNMGIFVNFQNFHTGYNDAYNYATKHDKQYKTSTTHPKMLTVPPKTLSRRKTLPASQPEGGSGSSGLSPSPSPSPNDPVDVPIEPKKAKRTIRLNGAQIHQIIVDNNIEDDLQLCALADEWLENNHPELASWVVNHPNEKIRMDTIKTSRKVKAARAQVRDQKLTRLEKLQSHLEKPHVKDEDSGRECNGRWLEAAIDILERNEIRIALWQKIISDCLQFGRNKKNNIFIVGQRNMGKSFLLRPLTNIYKTFCNPAKGSFNWVGAQNKEVILLNDFRYPAIDRGADRIMPWQDMLNLLDVDKLNVPAPKTFYAEDIEWTARQPIFANGPCQMQYICNGKLDAGETSQMDARWNYVHLKYTIPDDKLDTSILPCARCFAHLILNGDDIWNVI